MPVITSAGVGSGLDINSIISQLMAVERQPLVQLQQKQSAVQSQLSAYGRLRGAMSTFETAMDKLASLDKFKVYTATSSDEDVMTALAGSSASLGKATVVVSALAQQHKLASATYASESTTVGTGTLTVSVGSDSFNLTIDGTNNTLAGIRDAINNAATNTGVTATILNVTGGSRLVLTSNSSGAAEGLTVAVSGDGDGNDSDASGLSNLIWSSAGTKNLSQVAAAQDAAFTVDGFAATSASNSVTGVIQGVTLSLKTTGTASIDIGRDLESVKTSAKEFADAYNTLTGLVRELRAGGLAGDNALLSIESDLRSILNTPPSGITGTYRYLSEIGVAVQKDGKLAVDNTALETALKTDFSGVANVFADDDQGYAFRLEAAARGYLQIDGLIDSREDGLSTRIRDYGTRQDSMERRLVLIEGRYRAQFSALDSLLGSLQSTSAFLTQQLNSLNSSR
jgi:flagellar hook-associated protein 2